MASMTGTESERIRTVISLRESAGSVCDIGAYTSTRISLRYSQIPGVGCPRPPDRRTRAHDCRSNITNGVKSQNRTAKKGGVTKCARNRESKVKSSTCLGFRVCNWPQGQYVGRQLLLRPDWPGLPPLADLPYLFGGPLPRPVQRDELVPRRRALGRADLDQVLDLEARHAEEAHPVAVSEMELDARIARPFHSVNAERRAKQAPGRRFRLVLLGAEHEEERVRQEVESPARAEQARGLRDPFHRIRPQARAVLRDREVKGLVGVGDGFRVAVEQGELEGVLLLHAPRGLELLLGVVDAHHVSALPREPRGDVGRAAAELDRGLARDVVGDHTHVGLGDAPDAPAWGGLRPVPLGRWDVTGRLLVPVRAIVENVVGEFGFSHLASFPCFAPETMISMGAPQNHELKVKSCWCKHVRTWNSSRDEFPWVRGRFTCPRAGAPRTCRRTPASGSGEDP